MTHTHPDPARELTERAGQPLRGRPVAPSRGRLNPVGISDVVIDDGFWARQQQLNSSVMIHHCVDWAERVGWIDNFDAARDGRLPQDRRGRDFSDSEVYKLLEAMAWDVGRTGDASMEGRLRAVAERVAAAQEPDGYLNTSFGRPGQPPRYSNLEWGHELYCAGHLIQAGVARARTHGHDLLVETATRIADHVCDTFGPEGPLDGTDGHPEIEMALVELFRQTGERRYLDQALLFLDRRGHGRLARIEFGPAYFQDDEPVRSRTVLTGHAVRALYLAAGAVDAGIEAGDDDLFKAARTQLTTALARRTYVTGGMGAHHEGESFGFDFELPPDRAYSETCAAVASVMLNYRLLLATGDAVHADVIERTLFNVVATAHAADGHAFFYTNTLHQRDPGQTPAPQVPSPRAATPMRAPWFDVSCCPPNIARTLASLGAYVATTSARGVQIHQYASSTIRTSTDAGQRVVLRVRTRYPDDGQVTISCLEAPAEPLTLSLRVPAWARGATVRIGDEERAAAPGYVDIERTFRAGDTVELNLPVRARWTFPDPRVDAVRGTVAVERGPLVMCAESVDVEADVSRLVVDAKKPPMDKDGEVFVAASLLDLPDVSWPYGPSSASRLGRSAPREVRLIRYNEWANRGPSTMRVWLPIDDGGAGDDGPVD